MKQDLGCIRMKRENRVFLLMCFLGAVIILITRALSLTFHMDIHPDEGVFYHGTDSLLNSLLYGTEFVETKEYPEGAYLMHLPVQALGRLIAWLTGQKMQLRLWGRISSVFWFTGAVMLGMYLEYRHLGKNREAAVFYLLTMCFSLFFLEHSRYGVGDMISLFLLMAVVTATAKWCACPKSRGWILAAAFLSGALGAVKYPQMYFALIPIVTWVLVNRDSQKRKLIAALGLLLICLAGFLVFSPKGIQDLSYFYRVIEREMGAYVTTNNGAGIHNNIAKMLLHHLFFLEFPMAALLLAVYGIKSLLSRPAGYYRELLRAEQGEKVLFHNVLPVTIFGFLFYNVLVENLIMRTMTPYFGLCPLYTAWIVSCLYREGRWKKAVVFLLTVLLVLRGGAMIWVTSSDYFCKQYIETVQTVLEQQDGSGRIITLRGNYVPHKSVIFEGKEVQSLSLWEYEEQNNYDMEILPGDVVITGALEFSQARKPLLPTDNPDAMLWYDTWEYFRQENREHFVGTSTPGWIYYLLGCTVPGNSFAGFTLPRSYIYYHPLEH